MVRGVCVVVLAGAVARVSAAPTPVDAKRENDPAGLTRVDASRADVGPLRTSFRQEQVDLRAPTGFDTVYRLPGGNAAASGRASEESRYARVNGGLAAVFPRSQYTYTSRGVHVDIPANTTFFIGNLAKKTGPAAPDPLRDEDRAGATERMSSKVSGAVQTLHGTERVSMRAAVRESGPAETTRFEDTPTATASESAAVSSVDSARRTPPPKGVLSDETFRRARVRELLKRAAAGSDPGRAPTPGAAPRE